MQALELSQRNHELEMVDLKHSLLALETKHAGALSNVEEQVVYLVAQAPHTLLHNCCSSKMFRLSTNHSQLLSNSFGC